MTKDNSSIAAFKVWIFPTLVSLVSLLIWNDVNEIKADVKLLMAQSNIDKTRIDNLERHVYDGKTSSYPASPFQTKEPRMNEYAVIPDNKVKIVKYEF